jgi:hypothetical protein
VLSEAQVLTCISGLPKPSPKLGKDTIPENINLVTSIIASQIKQTHNTANIRLEQENDFLTCIELFNKALGTEPSDSTQLDYLSDQISWEAVTGGILGLTISTLDQGSSVDILKRGAVRGNPQSQKCTKWSRPLVFYWRD